MLSLGGRLYLAPIDDILLNNVLDIATRTGICAIEFASAFPAVKVLGTYWAQIQLSQ
jgi:methylase of polypeptide subunit release factors